MDPNINPRDIVNVSPADTLKHLINNPEYQLKHREELQYLMNLFASHMRLLSIASGTEEQLWVSAKVITFL